MLCAWCQLEAEGTGVGHEECMKAVWLVESYEYTKFKNLEETIDVDVCPTESSRPSEETLTSIPEEN